VKIKVLNFGIAGGITTSIGYCIIAFLIKKWPYETLQFIGSTHMIPRLENITPYIKISTTGIFIGASVHFVVSFVFFCFIAIIYNLFTRP
jgi:hypothetical protein